VRELMSTEDRREAVANLVHLRRSIVEAIDELRKFPWDSERELVTLGPSELRHALKEFERGEISAEELESWANGVEGRDDIEFRPRVIIDLIFEIANPLISRPLNDDTTADMLSRISELTPDITNEEKYD
jgi:hypothetical protein